MGGMHFVNPVTITHWTCLNLCPPRWMDTAGVMQFAQALVHQAQGVGVKVRDGGREGGREGERAREGG